MLGLTTSRSRGIDVDSSGLRRSLSFWQATASGVGIVIGAGIYVLVGEAAGIAGNAVWLSFLIAALLSSLTGLSYAELAGLFPKATAEYAFAQAAWGDFVAFVAGWMMLSANIIAAAAVSVGFGHYFAYFTSVDETLGAGGLLAGLLLLMLAGIQRSVWFSMVLLLFEIGGLVLVIVVGLPQVGSHDLLSGATFSGVVGGAALVFFAFIGFDEIVSLSEETHGASSVIPRALLTALWISSGFYVLVAIAAVSVLGWEQLSVSDAPLAQVMAKDWGDRAADVVAFVALASTTNTALLILTAASRLTYGIARDGRLPPMLGRVSKTRGTPDLASVAVVGASMAFIAIGELRLLASATDFTVYVMFLLTNAAVIVLRRKMSGAERSFKVPLSFRGLPVLPVAAIGSVILMMGALEPRAWLVGLMVMLGGVVVWLVRARYGVRPRASQ